MMAAIGKLRLEIDTNKTAADVALFQFQQGHLVFTGYHLMTLPEVVLRYGITELELTGLVCDIYRFSQLMKHQHSELAEHQIY